MIIVSTVSLSVRMHYLIPMAPIPMYYTCQNYLHSTESAAENTVHASI